MWALVNKGTSCLVRCDQITDSIGADSMGAIAPTAKNLWGQCPQVAPTRHKSNVQ